jgi:hypothetical protein
MRNTMVTIHYHWMYAYDDIEEFEWGPWLETFGLSAVGGIGSQHIPDDTISHIIRFTGGSLAGSQRNMADPDAKFIFLASLGSAKAIGRKPGTEVLVTNDKAYFRITNRDIGRSGVKSGLKRVRRKKLLYFLREMCDNHKDQVLEAVRLRVQQTGLRA